MPKRWMRPQDSEVLTSLLLHHKIAILPPFRRSVTSTTLEEAARFFLHPEVDIGWPIALADFCFNLCSIEGRQVEFIWNLDKEILCTAFKRQDVTGNMLDSIFPLFRDGGGLVEPINRDTISEAAFNSGKPEVVRWALRRGFSPSSSRLKTIAEALELSESDSEQDCCKFLFLQPLTPFARTVGYESATERVKRKI